MPFLRADLSDVLGERQIVAASVGPDGEAIVLAVPMADVAVVQHYSKQAGWAMFPLGQTERPFAATVLVHDGNRVRRTEIEGLRLAHPHIQMLPSGELLVVGARCWLSAETGPEQNASVYGTEGDLKRQFVLGDGIADVQTTRQGDVWVSYFDEGVYGNFGWGSGPDTEPIGATGLVKFDTQGAVRWRYPSGEEAPPIDDCYALNVAENAAWAYYYSDFPLVRIGEGGAVHILRTEVAGARAVAIEGLQVVFFGGYPPHLERCLLGRIEGGGVTELRGIALVSPSGAAFGDAIVIGRGSALHLFRGNCWYCADLRDLSG